MSNKVMQGGKLITRRRFLGLTASGVGALGYSRFGEPHWLEVNRPTLSITKAPQTAKTIKLLHLSDFHASRVVTLDAIREALELGLSLSPDLICLTGDFITSKFSDMGKYADVLKLLSSRAPTFACMGNHDGGLWARRWGYADWKKVAAMLHDASINLVHNRAERIQINSARLQLVGVGDLWAQELDANTAFRQADRALPTILLSHNPDSKEWLGGFNWDLMLCGHTHGGQLNLPIIGTPFAPVRDKRYVAGLKQWNNRWIHVTKGVGNLHGMRFNCRPEVSLLTVAV